VKGRESSTRWHAFLVASGILLSRISGLIRDRVFAHYFGNSGAADAFKAAFRIPNFLQNLFGEGVLSASFIPVYANLLSRGETEEANRVAGVIASLLILLTSIVVLTGILITPWLVDFLVPGFEGGKRDLCIILVRILFPGAGLLVWSAWCLGILNSYGHFLLSYTAPVIWNAVIIIALVLSGSRMGQIPLAKVTAWGAVIGSGMQVAVQLPMVFLRIKTLVFSLNIRVAQVGTVIRNFVPVFIGRGVVQISAYVDSLLASLLPTGAVAALSYAQALYTLPISLFGMSVSAAELPAMSKALGDDAAIAEHLRIRLNAGLRTIAFFIVPSMMAFLVFGDVVSAAIYQTGQFKHADAIYVWAILAGSSVGLLASTLGRLYSSVFYSLRDTVTPLRFAMIRVALATMLGYAASQHLPGMIHIPARWGVVGITAASGFCGWVEFVLLRSRLNRRIGKSGLAFTHIVKLWSAAGAGAAGGWWVKLLVIQFNPILQAVIILGAYGSIYFLVAFVMKVPEIKQLTRVMRLSG